jgi:capsular exopolysaccharide synthesis family protein
MPQPPLPPAVAGAAQTQLIWSDIPRRPWSPSLEKLPTLQAAGPAVERFRSLRSRIYELRGQRPLRSILVCSGLPQEGKSYIAANLATCLARHSRSRVLLIDGDMRRQSLHHLLGCQAEPGLCEYLSGNATAIEAMQRPEASPPGVGSGAGETLSNLVFIGAGKAGDQGADLSGSARFAKLLALAGAVFDWIIVDSCPVTLVSDAINLARACDGVLLVARGNVTPYTVAQKAHSEFRASHVLGFVLNAVESSLSTADCYGYYSAK